MIMALSSSHTGTHGVPLAISCLNTTGPVLELGCGFCSTPLLHTICKKQGRRLHTVDHTLSWLDKFNHLKTGFHTFEHVECGSFDVALFELLYRFSPLWKKKVDTAWDRAGEGEHWDLVFLDQIPLRRRVKDVKRLRASAEVFVIHNANPVGNFISGLWPYLETFKYMHVFPMFPATVVCSDRLDVRTFF